MSFGFSVGDIILCTQIAHRLFSSVTDGRKRAPRELKELEDALFGLCCALDHLYREHESMVVRTASKPDIVAALINQHLGYMIRSCQETLEELDNATAKYREAAGDPRHAPRSSCTVASVIFSPQFKAQVRIQWKRILWDLRGDSLTEYRQKLQIHTDSINLLLSTFIWSATDRIEKEGKRHAQRMDELSHQVSQFSKNVSQLVQSLQAPMTTARLHHPLDSPGSIRSIGQIMNTSLAISDGRQLTGFGSTGNLSIEFTPRCNPSPLIFSCGHVHCKSESDGQHVPKLWTRHSAGGVKQHNH